MINYNQVLGKIVSLTFFRVPKRHLIHQPNSLPFQGNSETITLKECNRRMSDSIEKRFCFDVVSDNLVSYTLQALR